MRFPWGVIQLLVVLMDVIPTIQISKVWASFYFPTPCLDFDEKWLLFNIAWINSLMLN